jgi:hypothetical protein
MTPKQESIYQLIRRYGKISGMTAIDVGLNSGYPRKKAEKWAKPALKELVKLKLIRREGEKYYPAEDTSTS